MTGGDAAACASPKAAKQIQCALEKTCMNGADATDMPNLIPRYSAQISAVFDSCTRLRWRIFDSLSKRKQKLRTGPIAPNFKFPRQPIVNPGVRTVPLRNFSGWHHR